MSFKTLNNLPPLLHTYVILSPTSFDLPDSASASLASLLYLKHVRDTLTSGIGISFWNVLCPKSLKVIASLLHLCIPRRHLAMSDDIFDYYNCEGVIVAPKG